MKLHCSPIFLLSPAKVREITPVIAEAIRQVAEWATLDIEVQVTLQFYTDANEVEIYYCAVGPALRPYLVMLSPEQYVTDLPLEEAAADLVLHLLREAGGPRPIVEVIPADDPGEPQH